MKLNRLLVATLATIMLFSLAALQPAAAQDTSHQQPTLGIIVFPFNFSHTGGVRVLGVQPNSPAAQAGIRPFDLIESVDGQAVTPKNFEAEVSKDAESGTLALSILRNNTTITVQAVLDDQTDAKTSLSLGANQAIQNIVREIQLKHTLGSALQSKMGALRSANPARPHLNMSFLLPVPKLSQVMAKPIL